MWTRETVSGGARGYPTVNGGKNRSSMDEDVVMTCSNLIVYRNA